MSIDGQRDRRQLTERNAAPRTQMIAQRPRHEQRPMVASEIRKGSLHETVGAKSMHTEIKTILQCQNPIKIDAVHFYAHSRNLYTM